MIRLFKSAAATLWATVLFLIILAGVVTAAAQLAAPLLGGFRTDVERWLESTLRTPVRIEGLAVRWRPRGPELVARNVAVLDLAGHPTVELGELSVAVSLGDVLRERRLRATRIGVAGVRLQILRRTDGSLGIRGVRPVAAEPPVGADAADSPAAALLLLLPEQLTVTDAEVIVEDRMRGRPAVTFRNASLALRNEGDHHEIDASLELPDPHRSPLRLAGRLIAEPAALQDWRADLYLDTTGAELAPLLSAVLPAHYRLDGARTDLRLWSHWEGGEPMWIEGRATVRNAAVSGVAAGRGLRIENATGAFVWDRRPDGWLLRVTDFVLDRPDRHSEPSEWGLAWRRGGRDTGPALHLVAERLALEDVASVLAVRPPGGERLARLLDAQPRGTLRDFDLQVAQRPSTGWRWSAAGKLDGGALTGGGAVPGVENLTLAFAASSEGGRVNLTTRGAELRAPGVLRRAITLDELGGAVDWRAATDGGWRVRGSDLRWASGGFRLGSSFDLDLAPDGSASIDLKADLAAVPVDHFLALLPVGVMDQRLVTWLDGALHGGTITSGSWALNGPLADFPFDERRTGRFEALLGIEGTRIDYAPGWPGLRAVDGRLRMQGYAVDIEVDRAMIYDSRLTKAHARIDAPPGSPVEFRGAIDGPLTDPLRLLRESPLRTDFGEIAGHLQGTGDARVELDFALPFDDAGKGRERLDGAVVFTGNELALAGWPLPLKGLEGRLGFDLKGLRAKGIQGQLLGAPALIDVQTDKSGVTTLTAALRRIDVRAFDELAAGALSRVRGAAALKAAVAVPPLHSRGKLSLRLDSDLKGVAIDLPAPVGKAADAARPLAVELGFAPEGPIEATARLGGDVDLAAQLDAATGRPLRATLTLGGARSELPRADRYALRGRVAALDVTGWLGLAERQPAPAEGAPPRPPLDVELTADRLLLGDVSLANARVTLRELPDAWLGEARAAELEGSFRYPRRSDHGPATLSLERLALTGDPTRSPTAASATKPAKAAVQDPRDYPGAVIEVQRLQLNGYDLGTARVVAGRVEKGLQLRELAIDGPAGRLGGGGDWLMTEVGPRTSLNFAVDTPDFGHLIVALGFADSIDRGPAKVNGEISWPGPPLDVSRQNVSGRVDLDMRNGRFLEIDPGVGRVMGLLNIAAIQRRLTLDFSDLFKKGLGFDAVTGHFSLESGLVRTEDLRIKGPSGVIEISGRTDVVAKEFDQIVTVTPSLGSTLPIAGAVVGGPVVGAALLVVQGLVGKQVDQIGAVRYSVQGPWSNPDIKVLAGRPLREMIQDAAKPPASPAPAAPAGQQAPAPVEGRGTGEAARPEQPKEPSFRLPDFH
jgi:uncharacterized protein (TIGR02099 family)